MTKIILDNFRRRWLMWALFCLLSLSAGLDLGIERDIRISAVVFISICMATMDWGFGCVRVLLSLPIAARQIGRAYWWLTVCASTLLFALFSATGILILRLAGTHGKFLGPWLEMFIATGPQDKFLGLWLETVLAGGLICGSMFAFMTGALWSAALSKAGESWRKRFPPQFYAWAFILALIGGMYFLFKSPISIVEKAVIAYLFGFIFSVPGWFRAERLFIDHSSSRLEFAGAGKSSVSRGKFEPRSGYGGVPYLIIRFCLFYLSIVALVIASTIVMAGITVWHDHGAKWSDIVSPTLLEIQIWLFLMCFVQTTIVGTHLKFLRSLPLTSKQLAATILCMAILPVLIIGGPWILFFLIAPGVLPSMSALSLLKFCLLNLAPVCVLTTGVIWYNEKPFTRITGVIVVLIVSAVPLIYQLATNSRREGLPIWIIIAVPVFSIFIALFTIRHLLERNEMTYRIKFELPPGWS
jgi:hypothetical protein